MIAYYGKVRALQARAALINHMSATLVRDGEALVTEHHALALAFRERVGRDYTHGEDQFTEADERRAGELMLEIFPRAGA